MSPHLPAAPRRSGASLRSRWLCLGFAACSVAGAAAAEPERVVTSLLEQRHEHVVIQEWDLSCGAAALTTLLRYQHGDPVTEKEVATELINRPAYLRRPELVKIRQGFSLLDLKRYVDARGYRGVGYGKMSYADLADKAPLLLPINALGYNHFVVFRGQMGNRILLADPAWGNRTMTVQEFESVWIDYPGLGRVGFVVRPDRVGNPGRSTALAPQSEDFVTFN